MVSSRSRIKAGPSSTATAVKTFHFKFLKRSFTARSRAIACRTHVKVLVRDEFFDRAVTFAASANRPVECSTRHLIELVYFESQTQIEMLFQMMLFGILSCKMMLLTMLLFRTMLGQDASER